MLAPVRTVAPGVAPVSLAEAKVHCRVDRSVTEDDDLIVGLIDAATAHLDGWSGVLGRALINQTWRQDFCGFSGCMRLPLAPCVTAPTITYFDTGGVQRTVAGDIAALHNDALGPFLSLLPGQAWPTTFSRSDAVSVSFVAGYGPAPSDIPAALRTAILMMVAHLYSNREAVGESGLAALPLGVEMLIGPYRRIGL